MVGVPLVTYRSKGSYQVIDQRNGVAPVNVKTSLKRNMTLFWTVKRFSDDSVQNVRNMLMCIDECPHSKHPKYNIGVHEDMGVEKMDHSILCTDGSCKSPLRLLKQACTHHSNISPLYCNLLGVPLTLLVMLTLP